MKIDAQIKEVYFERVFNLGNYETFRLGLHATVGPKQVAEEVIHALDDYTMNIRNKKLGGKNGN
jgi:hypothetical protein